MKKSLLSVLLCLVLASLHAEVVPLDSCLSWARSNNAALQASRWEVEASQELQRQVFTKFFPQVDATALGFMAVRPMVSVDVQTLPQTELGRNLVQLLYDFARELDPNTQVSQRIDLMQQGFSVGGKLVQPLYAGGRIVTGHKLTQLGVRAAEEKSAMTERDLLQEVEETYWMVAGLQEKRATLQAVMNLLDTVSHVAETAYGAGLVSNNDLLRVKLKRNEMETKQLQLENGIRLATKFLCLQVGRPSEGEWEFEPFDTTLVMVAPVDTFAIESRPEYELLSLNVQAEQLQKRLTMGEALPLVALTAFGGYSDFYGSGNANLVGLLTLQIPLTQWWEMSHKLKIHDIRIRQAESMQDDLRRKMLLQNEQVYMQLTEAVQLMRERESSLEMATENYRLSLLNYEAGMATMSELLESYALLLSAHDNCTDSRIAYRSSLRRFNDLNRQP